MRGEKKNTHWQNLLNFSMRWPHPFFIEVRCQNSISRQFRAAQVPAVNTKSGAVGLSFDEQMCFDGVWLLGSVQQSLCKMWRCCGEMRSFREHVLPSVTSCVQGAPFTTETRTVWLVLTALQGCLRAKVSTRLKQSLVRVRVDLGNPSCQ